MRIDLRKVAASIRVTFMGSVLAIAASIGAGRSMDGTPPILPRRLSTLRLSAPGIWAVLYSGWGRRSITFRPGVPRWPASQSVSTTRGMAAFPGAAAIPALVSALNKVDFPTLGRPTIPHFKLMDIP